MTRLWHARIFASLIGDNCFIKKTHGSQLSGKSAQLASVGLFGRQGDAAYRIRPAGRHCILGPLRFCALGEEVLAPRLLTAFRLPLRLVAVACPANARDNGLIRFVAINRYLNITEIRIDRQGLALRNSETLTEVKSGNKLCTSFGAGMR